MENKPEKPGPLFGGKSIDDVIANNVAPREVFEQPKEPTPPVTDPAPEAPKEPKIDGDKPDKPASEGLKTKSGAALFGTTDIAMRKLASFISGEPSTLFKLSDDEGKELKELWGELAGEYKKLQNIPPWVPLLIAFLFVYGLMIWNSFEIRKQKNASKPIPPKPLSKIDENGDTEETQKFPKAFESDTVRACPECGEKIEYTSKKACDIARNKNTKCKKCAQK